ncbi:hypothetical protein [Thermovibrio sp.]
MEIRRIEGIIPVEAVNRDLPLKLENFSYYEMKKILSQVLKGESKDKTGDKFEELLLRAIVVELLEGNRVRLKVGNSLLTAQVKVEEGLSPGTEVLLKVKSLTPERLEFSLVKTLPLKFLTSLSLFYLKKLNFLFKGKVKELLLREALKHFPELSEGLERFLSAGFPYLGRELFLSLLLLSRKEVYESLKGELPKKEEIRELLEFALNSLLLYSFLRVFVLTITEEAFRGTAVLGNYEGMAVVLLEGETPLGEVKLLLKLLGRSLSVEFSSTEEFKRRFKEGDLRELLKEEGLNLVLLKEVEAEEIEEVKRKLLKGHLVEFTA